MSAEKLEVESMPEIDESISRYSSQERHASELEMRRNRPIMTPGTWKKHLVLYKPKGGTKGETTEQPLEYSHRERLCEGEEECVRVQG